MAFKFGLQFASVPNCANQILFQYSYDNGLQWYTKAVLDVTKNVFETFEDVKFNMNLHLRWIEETGSLVSKWFSLLIASLLCVKINRVSCGIFVRSVFEPHPINGSGSRTICTSSRRTQPCTKHKHGNIRRLSSVRRFNSIYRCFPWRKVTMWIGSYRWRSARISTMDGRIGPRWSLHVIRQISTVKIRLDRPVPRFLLHRIWNKKISPCQYQISMGKQDTSLDSSELIVLHN